MIPVRCCGNRSPFFSVNRLICLPTTPWTTVVLSREHVVDPIELRPEPQDEVHRCSIFFPSPALSSCRCHLLSVCIASPYPPLSSTAACCWCHAGVAYWSSLPLALTTMSGSCRSQHRQRWPARCSGLRRPSRQLLVHVCDEQANGIVQEPCLLFY